jgi:hypothetical protein
MTAAIVIFLSACGEKNESASSTKDSTATTADSTANVATPYFPVYDFIRNEIEYVDSLPVGIMKFTTTGKKKDSGYIRLEEFHSIADEFLAPEIYDSAFKRLFRETSFIDRSNGTATFFYKTDDESSPIKRVDVVTAKGEVYDEVRSLYIEKQSRSGDSTLVKKIFWKPKRNFQMTIIATSDNGKSKSEQVKVVWDNRE